MSGRLKRLHQNGLLALSGRTHIAIHEALEGQVADWLEHVTDEDYLKPSDK